jgi:hypothetical protein
MLEHQVEQLHRLCDLGFRHWLSAPDPGNELPYHPTPQSAAALAYGKLIGSTKLGS